jgi:hypothetical protein
MTVSETAWLKLMWTVAVHKESTAAPALGGVEEAAAAQFVGPLPEVEELGRAEGDCSRRRLLS